MLVVMLAAAVAAGWSQAPIAGTQTEGAPPCPLTRGEERTVSRVHDGETLQLDDGRLLRLIGSLAPRAADVDAEPGTWPAEHETRKELAALAGGRTITLWHDTSRSDRYGRVLAHATVGTGPDAAWIQGVLVSRGLARAFGRPGVDACTEALVRHEGRAREAGLGLWSIAAYAVREADDDVALARAVGRFEIVRGTVRRVSRGQSELFVTLAASRGRGGEYPFAAIVPARGAVLLGGVDPRQLQGRRVLARGWIVQRRGPVIVIDSKGQLEVLGE
jgi:micrococcal nuclease